MLKRIEKISFRISSVLSKVEVEPKPGAGPSHRLRPKSAGSGSTTLAQSMFSDRIIKAALIWILRRGLSRTRSWRREDVEILRQFTRLRCFSWGSRSTIPSRKSPLSLVQHLGSQLQGFEAGTFNSKKFKCKNSFI